jgi:hypothetical protein
VPKRRKPHDFDTRESRAIDSPRSIPQRGTKLHARRPGPTTKARHARNGWRRWIAVFTVLAFALQVQLIQTHFHPLFGNAAFGGTANSSVAQTPAKKNSPANNDPANCPICQAVLHGGQFISPGAVALALPSEAITLVPLAIAAVAAREIASHNWQGRAPPHA